LWNLTTSACARGLDLTLRKKLQSKNYRRSGISPCPEDIIIITKKACQSKQFD